jgi:hypothetical protein
VPLTAGQIADAIVDHLRAFAAGTQFSSVDERLNRAARAAVRATSRAGLR